MGQLHRQAKPARRLSRASFRTSFGTIDVRDMWLGRCCSRCGDVAFVVLAESAVDVPEGLRKLTDLGFYLSVILNVFD